MTTRRRHLLIAAALCAVVFAGGALRVHNLGRPALIEDELFHVFGAASLLETGKPTLPSGMSYTRAYPFTRIVSYSYRWLGVSEFSSRLAAAVFGLAAIVLTFALAAFFAGPGTGLVAAAFMAASPFGVVLSRYTRMYTMHQCLYLLALLLFFLAFESRFSGTRGDRTRQGLRAALALAAWAACLAFDMKIHSLAVFFFAGLFGYAALMTAGLVWRDGWHAAARTRYAAASAALLAALLASFAVPEIRSRLVESFLWVPEWSRSNVDQHLFYHRFFARQHAWVWVFLVPGTLALAWRRPRAAAYLFAALAFPAAALSAFPLKSERYVFHLYPVYLALMAHGLVWALSAAVSAAANLYCRHWRVLRPAGVPALSSGAVAAAAACLLVFLLPGSVRARKIPAMESGAAAGIRFQPWKEVGEALRRRAGPRDVLIASRTAPVRFYCGRADYSLNRMARTEILQAGVTDADGRLLDYTSGAVYLATVEDLRRASACAETVWLVVETSLLDPAKGRLSAEELRFVREAFSPAGTTSDGSVAILRRREGERSGARTAEPHRPKFVTWR